mgnify:CR=1 FL=1
MAKSSIRLSDEEIIASLESEERLALDASTGELAKERADALERYRGALLGNEVEGRSQIVDRSVMDTIEWIMPSLMRIFMGGDEIGKFEPVGPEDERQAQEDTDVCNWYLQNRGDFFSQASATLRDALLLKNGYNVVVWQRKYDTMTETYKGLSDEEAAMLAQDPEVTVIEHTETIDPVTNLTLHDIKVELKKCEEYPEPESVPPDEIVVSRRHRWTSLLDADFVEWVRRVTIGQLRAEGFSIPDDMLGDDTDSLESNSRDRFEENPFNRRDDETNDPSRRIVTFRDAYMRIDMRGSGTPQLWRLARISGIKRLVLKEEANIIPLAAFSPIIYPHSHVGMSVYDLIADLGVIKTTLQRQFLDGLYLQNSGRMGVDINKIVNMDDLLVSRPGGVVRTDGHPSEALFPIQSPDASSSALAGLEYMEAQKEGRTGVTRYSAGLDANTLNKTATGVQAIQAAANQRIELIARTLAGGFKDLFLILHALTSKHSTKPLKIKLKGEWKAVDPRQWKKRTDFSVSVGLGTGTPEQQLQKLMMLTPVFQQGMQMGLAGPAEAYNFGSEIWKAAGYKVADRFIKPPKMAPKMGPDGQPVMGPDGQPVMEAQAPPPQKDPVVQAEEVKAQTAMQIEPLKLQNQMQIEQFKTQNNVQQAQIEAEQAAQLEQFKIEKQAELERYKIEQQAMLEKYKIDESLKAEILKEQIKAQAQIRSTVKAQTGEDPEDEEVIQRKKQDEEKASRRDQVSEATAQALMQVAAHLARPRKIVRDQRTGRAEGLQ